MSEQAKAACEKIMKLVDGNESLRIGVEIACDVIEANRAAGKASTGSDETKK